MNQTLVETLQTSQDVLDPQFKALRAATGALKQATRLASEEKADALAMQKAQAKLEQAAELLGDFEFSKVVDAFGQETQKALEALAFDFARDLKEMFEARGETVEGRPPRLVINDLVLEIDISTRKAQWIYGKEPLTKPIALSFNPILRAYDAQKKAILDREINTDEFLSELYVAWEQLIEEKGSRPTGGRVNIIAIYSKVVLNRQNTRFWNAPARATFKDYERAHFVRDLVLASKNPTINVDGAEKRLFMGGATKAQAERASTSIWMPTSALDGAYYANISFDPQD